MVNRKRSLGCLTLAAALLMTTLCGCGKASDTASEAEQETPEYMYKSSETKLSRQAGSSLYNPVFTDDGFYATSYEKVGEDIPDGAVLEYEGQYDVYGSALYYVSFDGTVKKLDGYTPMTAESTHANGTASDSISAFCLGSDDKLYVVESLFESWSDAGDDVEPYTDEWYAGYQSSNDYYLRILDTDGNELSCSELQMPAGTDANSFYIYDAEAAADGTLLLAGDNLGVMAYSTDGTCEWTVPTDSWIDNFLKTSDGTVYALYPTGDNYEYVIAAVDTEKQALKDEQPLATDSIYNLTTGGGDYDLYYSSGVTLYGFNIGDEEPTRLLTWISVDVNDDSMGGFVVRDDNSIIEINNEWNSDYTSCTTSLINVTRQPYDASAQKETLTLATGYLDYELKARIISFNRNSSDVRIDVKEYENDVDAFNTDVMAGNVPDLIDLDTFDEASLTSNNRLEDLYTYLENDPDINSEDYFENVWEAMSSDGHLYALGSKFYIETVIGAASVVGDTPGWTYEQMNQALTTMPEGCTAFSAYTTRETILKMALNVEASNLIDWSTGECNFDSDSFRNLLTFAAQFPEEYDWSNYTEEDDDYAAIQSGRQMLMSSSVSMVDDVMSSEVLFGGNATFIGFPTDNGTGNLLHITGKFGISSTCADKEAAWSFLRTTLLEDYQDSLYYDLPILRSSFEKKLDEAMTPEYEKDANGNYILDADGNRIEQAKYSIATGSGADDICDIYAMTQEQADKVLELVESTDKVASGDTTVYDIVNEEAAGFFAGQKSLDDTVKQIQSRMSLYVSEQM